jgi:hypothetical protein
MVKVWFTPAFTFTVPEGEIVPPLPAEAVMEKLFVAKLADTVQFPVMGLVV